MDRAYKSDWNKLNFSGTSKEHQDMIYEICWWLYENNIPFITEARFTTGYRPDIIVPDGLPRQIIEVRHSEGSRQSVEKFSRTPEELLNEIIYVEAGQKFKKELIL